MSEKVFVISEWQAKKGCAEELWHKLQDLMNTTEQQEPDCLSARATQQITHPGSPGITEYDFVLMQTYKNIAAFDQHCDASYVKDFVANCIDNPETALIANGTCRLFSESAGKIK